MSGLKQQAPNLVKHCLANLRSKYASSTGTFYPLFWPSLGVPTQSLGGVIFTEKYVKLLIYRDVCLFYGSVRLLRQFGIKMCGKEIENKNKCYDLHDGAVDYPRWVACRPNR